MQIKKGKVKKKKCVYCGVEIEWGLTCVDCGYREDKALGKVD
jgi:hypothetical protein